MRTTIPTHLTDSQLIDELKRCSRGERDATAVLVAHLAEMDARRLHLAAGFPSLFAYCCEVLRMSESATYKRIDVARAARRYPAILDALTEGSLNLTTARLLAPHLTGENHQELLAAASGLGKRAVEELVARRFPRPDVLPLMRKLPTSRPVSVTADATTTPNEKAPDQTATPGVDASTSETPTGEPPAGEPPAGEVEAGGVETGGGSAIGVPPNSGPGHRRTQTLSSSPRFRAVVTPLSADRYQIRFTAGAATWEKLRIARDLLRHAVPSGDPEQIFDRALSALIDTLAKKKCAAAKAPAGPGRAAASGSRHVPAHVRRAVWIRDRGRCAFVAASGRQCRERGFLEYHHVRPYAVGGPATLANIELRCRAHNAHEAVLFFGKGRSASYGLSAACSTGPGASKGRPITSAGHPVTARSTGSAIAGGTRT